MIINKETLYTQDVASNKLTVVREFDAPVDHVWKAWTDSKLLDQWWAPLPWKAKTKTMNFRDGGHWLYAMMGPAGEQMWCRVDFKNIEPGKSFVGVDYFCDESGNKNADSPLMQFTNIFSKTVEGTKVEVVINFESEADMEKIIEMGFKEGFAAAHGNLDNLLASLQTV
jgi:uncharacterized protein YndB with AHSA1/START domain